MCCGPLLLVVVALYRSQHSTPARHWHSSAKLSSVLTIASVRTLQLIRGQGNILPAKYWQNQKEFWLWLLLLTRYTWQNGVFLFLLTPCNVYCVWMSNCEGEFLVHYWTMNCKTLDILEFQIPDTGNLLMILKWQGGVPELPSGAYLLPADWRFTSPQHPPSCILYSVEMRILPTTSLLTCILISILLPVQSLDPPKDNESKSAAKVNCCYFVPRTVTMC